MTAVQQALLEKARRALAAARAGVARDDAETAINRAYYATFYAAQAALDTFDEHPKTHTGVLRRFQHHFVQPGRLPLATGGILAHAFDLRQRADYDAFATFETRRASDLVDDAGQFVQAVEALLHDPSRS